MARRRFYRGKKYRATGRHIFAKQRGPGYVRVKRGLYKKPYDARKWVKMMRNPQGKKKYAWRLRGRAATRDWKKLLAAFAKQPAGIRKMIQAFMGSTARRAGSSWY